MQKNYTVNSVNSVITMDVTRVIIKPHDLPDGRAQSFWVILGIDLASRMIKYLYVSENHIKAVEVVECLKCGIAEYGEFERLHTDRGGEFTALDVHMSRICFCMKTVLEEAMRLICF